jgi:hypothetical protein
MVFMFWMASILPTIRAPYPLRPAAGLPLDILAHDVFSENRKPLFGIMHSRGTL